MNPKVNAGRGPGNRDDNRGTSQMVFIAVGLAIIVGGLWFLYDANLPYHPDFPVSEGQVIVVDDAEG